MLRGKSKKEGKCPVPGILPYVLGAKYVFPLFVPDLDTTAIKPRKTKKESTKKNHQYHTIDSSF